MDEDGTIGWDDALRLEREFPNIRAVSGLLASGIKYEAISHAELRVADSSVDSAKRYLALNRALVWASRNTGYWSESEDFCKSGIEVARLLGDNSSLGYRCTELSSIYRSRNELTQAKQWAEAAIAAFHQCHELKAAAHNKRQLGMIALAQGDIELASILTQEAYDTYVQLSVVNLGLSYYHAFGQIMEQRGNLVAAEQWYQKAVVVSRSRDEIQRISHSLYHLGLVYLKANDLEQSNKALDESLQLAIQCGRVELIALNRLGLASIGKNRSDSTAATHARQALNLFRRLGMRNQQAEAEELLRQIGEQV